MQVLAFRARAGGFSHASQPMRAVVFAHVHLSFRTRSLDPLALFHSCSCVVCSITVLFFRAAALGVRNFRGPHPVCHAQFRGLAPREELERKDFATAVVLSRARNAFTSTPEQKFLPCSCGCILQQFPIHAAVGRFAHAFIRGQGPDPGRVPFFGWRPACASQTPASHQFRPLRTSYIAIYIYICYKHIYISICAYTHVYIYIYIHVYIYIYIYIYIDTHTYIHTYMCMQETGLPRPIGRLRRSRGDAASRSDDSERRQRHSEQ